MSHRPRADHVHALVLLCAKPFFCLGQRAFNFVVVERLWWRQVTEPSERAGAGARLVIIINAGSSETGTKSWAELASYPCIRVTSFSVRPCASLCLRAAERCASYRCDSRFCGQRLRTRVVFRTNNDSLHTTTPSSGIHYHPTMDARQSRAYASTIAPWHAHWRLPRAGR